MEVVCIEWHSTISAMFLAHGFIFGSSATFWPKSNFSDLGQNYIVHGSIFWELKKSFEKSMPL